MLIFTKRRNSARSKFVSRIVTSAVALAMTSSCSAQAKANEWTCAVPNGSFDNNAIAVKPDASSVTGEIIFRKAELGERWYPRARVGFVDSKQPGSGCKCNGFMAMVFPDQPDFITIYFVTDGQEKPVGHVPYDKPVTFNLSFDTQNLLTLRIGSGIDSATPIHADRDSLLLACTSAEVVFQNIKVE